MSESVVYKGCTSREVQLKNGIKTARRTLLFFCPADTPASEVLSDEHVPAEGDVFDDDPELYCSEVHLRTNQLTQGRVEIVCVYDKKTESLPELSSGISLDRQPAFNVSIRSVENIVPFEFAYASGDSKGEPSVPVTDSAGISIPAKTTELSLILTFSYYRNKFSPDQILSYCNTVNSSQIQICGITLAPQTAYLRKLGAAIVQTRGKTVSRIDAEIEIRPGGFERVFADTGLFIKGADGKPKRLYSAVSDSGNLIYGTWYEMWGSGSYASPIVSVDEPLALNGAGGLAAANASPAKLRFKERFAAAWSTLKFPSKARW